MRSRIWITADHHFGHVNIIRHCSRPFRDVTHMDEEMIARWNERVAPDDLVYHLGDFCYRSSSVPERYLARLNGKVVLVAGNHDTERVRRVFAESHDILTTTCRDRLVFMCHYPMRSWRGSNRGSVHCHGHCHGSLTEEGRSMDVGVDTNDFYPYELEAVVERLSAIPLARRRDQPNDGGGGRPRDGSTD